MTTIFISWTCFLLGLFVIFAGLSLVDARSVRDMTSTLSGGFAALIMVRLRRLAALILQAFLMTFTAVVLSGHALRRARFDRARGPKPIVVDLETSRKIDPEAAKTEAKQAVDATRKLLATEPEEEPAKPSLLSRAHPLRKHGWTGLGKSGTAKATDGNADGAPIAPAEDAVASAANSPSDANGAKKAVKTLRFA